MNYKLNKHIYLCGKYYLLLLVIFVFGFSSGVWFYHITNSNVLCHSTVLLLQSACLNLNESFWFQLGRMLILILPLLVGSFFKPLFWVGYVETFLMSVILGASALPVKELGLVAMLFSCVTQFFQIGLVMYLTSLNSNHVFVGNRRIAGRIEMKRLRIFISVFLLLILQIFISAALVVKINFL